MSIPTVSVDQVPDPFPENLTVLDVREPVEWHYGHLAGSIHVPMAEIPERLAEVPTDVQVLVVCKVGSRSARVVQFLQHHGIDAFNLEGGLLEWHAAGRPLVSDAGDPVVV